MFKIMIIAGIAQWYSATLRSELWEFGSRQGLGIFLFTTASRPALMPTQPPMQWVPGALSLGVKRLWREADHSRPSSAEVKNAWNCTSTPPISLYDMVLSLILRGAGYYLKSSLSFSLSKISFLYGIRRFITKFTKAPQ
jgi:hypothetical protein